MLQNLHFGYSICILDTKFYFFKGRNNQPGVHHQHLLIEITIAAATATTKRSSFVNCHRCKSSRAIGNDQVECYQPVVSCHSRARNVIIKQKSSLFISQKDLSRSDSNNSDNHKQADDVYFFFHHSITGWSIDTERCCVHSTILSSFNESCFRLII